MATAKIGFSSVSGDSAWLVQPAAGEEWCLNSVSTWGDGTNNGNMGIYDGTATAILLNVGYGIGDGDADYTCLRDAKVFIDNAIYLRIYNHNSSAQYCSYHALELNITVRAGRNSTSANSGWAVQPAAGEEWIITSLRTRGDGVTAGYANIYNGTNSGAKILEPTLTNPAGEGDATEEVFRDGKILIDNSSYLLIYNESESIENLGYSGMLLP